MAKNIQLGDELMGLASGGLARPDPVGYLCEASVLSGTGSTDMNAQYRVEADNGRTYLATWAYRSILKPGDRVQLIHDESGMYELEAIME